MNPNPNPMLTDRKACATLGTAPSKDVPAHHIPVMTCEWEYRSLSSVALFSPSPSCMGLFSLTPLPLPSTRPYDTPSIIIFLQKVSVPTHH